MSSQILGFPMSNPPRKLHITSGRLPSHPDPLQSPSKKAPWRQIQSTNFAYSVDIVMPVLLYDLVRPKISDNRMAIKYAKVVMKLEDILTGDFFSDYVKKGNISMLAEGDPHSGDCIMSLHSGVIRLDMPHTVYERAGLPDGTVIPSGGQKHTKSRFRIEYQLRSASMLKGRKRFDRLLYAARYAVGLKEARNWLFQDLKDTTSGWAERPLQNHHPTIVEDGFSLTKLDNLIVPEIIRWPADDIVSNKRFTEEESVEVAEWLDLAKLKSPRIHKDDTIDPFICQYSLPGNDDELQSQSLRKLSWKGFIDDEWILRLLSELIHCTRLSNSRHWLSLSTVAHATEAIGEATGYTILFQPLADEGASLDRNSMDINERGTLLDGSSQKHNQQRGLQAFTVFQYFDSLTP